MSGMTDALGLTQLEEDEFRIARQKLHAALVEATGRVETAIAEAERTGDVYGVQDLIYQLNPDALQRAFQEAAKPITQAAKRMDR